MESISDPLSCLAPRITQKKLQNNIGESQTTRGNLQLANSFGRFHGFVQNYHQVDSSMAR